MVKRIKENNEIHYTKQDNCWRCAHLLEQAGVRVVATRYNGMIHGFFQMAGVLDDGKMVIDQTIAALRAAFAK